MPSQRPISLAGLRGFVAVAQSGSFTGAANLLHLTQSALSRQIQSLEAEIGCDLMARTTRRVSLTDAGDELLRAAIAGLAQVDECVAKLRQPTPRKRVSVSTFVSFASLWLIPRLGKFGASYPDVDVNCMASDRLVQLDVEGIDVALRCSATRLVAPDAEFLFDETLIPICSATYLASGPHLRTPADLKLHALLSIDESELSTPTFTWQNWLANNGCAGMRGRSEIRFTNSDQVVQAALAGQGVALARAPLVIDLLDAGHLVPLFDYPFPTRYAYYMVTTSRSRHRESVQEFVAWVAAESMHTRDRLTKLQASAAARGKSV